MNYPEATTIAKRLWDLMVDAIHEQKEDRMTLGPSPKPFGARAGMDNKPFMEFIPRQGATHSTVKVSLAQGLSALRKALIAVSAGATLNTSTLGAQASGSYLLVLWHEVVNDYVEKYGPIPGVTDRA